jgi:hypothetical protein
MSTVIAEAKKLCAQNPGIYGTSGAKRTDPGYVCDGWKQAVKDAGTSAKQKKIQELNDSYMIQNFIQKEINRINKPTKPKVKFPQGDPRKSQLLSINKQLNNLRFEKEIFILNHPKSNADARKLLAPPPEAYQRSKFGVPRQ